MDSVLFWSAHALIVAFVFWQVHAVYLMFRDLLERNDAVAIAEQRRMKRRKLRGRMRDEW